jgi:hypothetical protein
MENNYIVIYSVQKEDVILEVLKAFSESARYVGENHYLLKSERSAKELFNAIKDNLIDNDKIIIAEINKENTFGYTSADIWDYVFDR